MGTEGPKKTVLLSQVCGEDCCEVLTDRVSKGSLPEMGRAARTTRRSLSVALVLSLHIPCGREGNPEVS